MSLENPQTWMNYPIAALSIYLMYKLTSRQMKEVTREIHALRVTIERFADNLTKRVT